MSSSKRPWYQWWPKDFKADEKVQCLSPIAELIYRRVLDVMWEANDCQLPSNCLKIANAVGKGLSEDEFKNAWSEIQSEGFELLKTSKCGKFIYSKRLVEQMKNIELISKKRQAAGRKGGKANAKQMVSKCHSDDGPFD